MARKKSVQGVINSQKKLKDLQQEIMALQEKEKELQKEIALNLSTLLSDIGAHTIPQDVLIGGILHIIDSVKNNTPYTPQIGEWQQAGHTFLEQKKAPKSKSKKDKSSYPEAA